MSRQLLLKGGAVLAAGNALSAAASFLRNLIVARFVSVEDFGIVVLLALALSAIETVSNLAIDRLLVQDPDGDSAELQANSHALQVARGIVGALAIFICAPWVAVLFKIPETTWAFQALSLVPAVRGFMHLDSVRAQRQLAFVPSFWVMVIPQAVSIILVVPLVLWSPGYSVVVWVMLVQALVHTLVSHWLAERPYRWSWTPATVRRIVNFGWPLLVNGLLMFIIFEGDKAIIATAFSPEVVGWYGAAFMLTIAPAMFLTAVMQNLLLPVLSPLQHDVDRFRTKSLHVINAALALGLLVGAGFIMFGPELLRLLFGERYANGASVVVVLGVTQGLRIAKAGQFTSAIAIGATRIPLLSNLARGGGMVLAVLLVSVGFGPNSVALAGLASEATCFILAMILLGRRLDLRYSEALPPAMWWGVLASAAFLLADILRQHVNVIVQLLAGALLLTLIVMGFLYLSPGARDMAKEVVKK